MKKLLYFPGLCILVLASAFFASCELGNPPSEETFTFPTLADSLKGADSAVIVVKGMDGTPIDTLFKDRISPATEFNRLPAPHYKGGTVLIEIHGYKDGVKISQTEKHYSGTSGKTDTTFIIVSPATSLQFMVNGLTITEGDAMELPQVVVQPGSLHDQRIAWSASPDSVLRLDGDSLRGLRPGAATLRASLVVQPERFATLPVTVVPRVITAQKPRIVSLSPEARTVSIHDSVAFAAEASIDSGSLASFAWDYDGDGQADASGALSGDSAQIGGGYRFADAADYTVQLTVKDSLGAAGSRQAIIHVIQDAPRADAGPDVSARPGASVTLIGQGYDSLGIIVKREWKIGTGGFGIATRVPADTAFAAPSVDGTTWAWFRVTDDDGLVAVDSVRVVVSSSTDADLSALSLSAGTLTPPFAVDGLSYSAAVDNATSSITVTPTKADPAATITVNGMEVASASASGDISLREGGVTRITITVAAQNGVTSKSYAVDVTRRARADANLSGLAVSTGILSQDFRSDTEDYQLTVPNTASSFRVTPTASHDSARIKVNNLAVTSGTASQVIPITGNGTTTATVQVTAQDGSTVKSYVITVKDRAPVFNSPADTASVDENSPLSLTFTASDPDGGALALSTFGTTPSGSAFNIGTGQFTWTPTYAQGGTHSLTVRATSGSLFTDRTVTINVRNVNRPPVFTQPTDSVFSINEGQNLSIAFEAVDADGTTVTLGSVTRPVGSTFNGGAFAWVPGFTQSGLHNVTVSATSGGQTVNKTVRITVANVPNPPAAPGNLVATRQGNDGISLSWTDNSGNESKFVIQRSTSNAFTSPTVFEVTENTVSYTDAGLGFDRSYYYRVRAEGSEGQSAWSATANGTTWKCGEGFVDLRDSKSYRTVQIGSQCWFRDNLDYSSAATSSSRCYDDELSNCIKYGRLYTWTVATADNHGNGKDICPVGFHVPMDQPDLWPLYTYIDANSGTWIGNPKSYVAASVTSGELFSKCGQPGGFLDPFEFSMLPGGYYAYQYSDTGSTFRYVDEGSAGYFWTANPESELNASNIPAFRTTYDHGCETTSAYFLSAKLDQLNVRCLKD
jgi:uncharacterized protein (TIGR02145 family)